jgi:hypothetical protein
LDKHLHIVSFNVPFPADYGGVIDIFNTIKGLHEFGIHVHLHCFEYGRGEQPELNQFCENVHYYPRQRGHKGYSAQLPYIVSSRSSESLLMNLLSDDYPILLQGIHCTFLLNNPRFSSRKIIVRLFNVEHIYYKHLYRSSNSWFKKIYYARESRLLKHYERKIANKATFLAFSEEDAMRYREELGAERVSWLPPLLSFNRITSDEGKGCFCLYHGNLEVEENEKAATWLLEKVFNDLKIPLVIAGKNPSRKLEKLAKLLAQACLVADLSGEEMQDMIHKAQINIIPSFNKTGIKLKLLNALFNGRHCLVNSATVRGTGLESLCHIAESADSFKRAITNLYHQPFTPQEIELRSRTLKDAFDQKDIVQKLSQWIW